MWSSFVQLSKMVSKNSSVFWKNSNSYVLLLVFFFAVWVHTLLYRNVMLFIHSKLFSADLDKASIQLLYFQNQYQ